MWERNLGPAACPDVAVTAEGILVTATGEPMFAWLFTPEGQMSTVVISPKGYFPKTNGQTIVYHDGDGRFWAGAFGKEPTRLGFAPIGNNPTGISRNGTIYLQRNDLEEGVYDGLTKVADYRPTGIWEAWDDGSVTMADDCRCPVWAPGAEGMAHRCHPVTVAEGPQGGVIVYLDGTGHALWRGTNTKEPRVSVWGDRAAIVSWGDLGLRVWSGTLDEIRALPTWMPAIGPLQPGRKLDIAYFYRSTAILQYGKADADGGIRATKNPAAPCTADIILDWAGLPSDPTPDGFVPAMIVSPECLWTVALHPEWWPRILGIYVAAEGSLGGLNAMAETTRYLLQRLGLPDWPLVTYTGNALYPDALRPTDWIGVQLYCPQDATMSPADALAMGRTQLAQVAHRQSVALICQAYDRARPDVWTDEALAALQPVWWTLAREFPNVRLLALFSDGRQGGTRWHEGVRPSHAAMVQAALAARR